jgi:hypothetical protein
MQEVTEEAKQDMDLLFDKHIDYVVNHGNDKNDFVRLNSIGLIDINLKYFPLIRNTR